VSAPDLGHVESADEQADDLDAAPAAEQADAPRVEALEREPLTSLPPTNPPTGDPTMNEEKKQALALEAKQLEKSIAAAKAAGQTARAEALEARRQRVIARGAA